MFFAEPTLSQSSPSVRDATYWRTIFFRIHLCLSRDFVNQHVFCCSIYSQTAQNSRGECNEFANLLFGRLSLFLSRDSLSCDTGLLDLCILFYTSDTFRPIVALFTHFTLHQFFLVYITTPRNIFPIPDDACSEINYHF